MNVRLKFKCDHLFRLNSSQTLAILASLVLDFFTLNLKKLKFAYNLHEFFQKRIHFNQISIVQRCCTIEDSLSLFLCTRENSERFQNLEHIF